MGHRSVTSFIWRPSTKCANEGAPWDGGCITNPLLSHGVSAFAWSLLNKLTELGLNEKLTQKEIPNPHPQLLDRSQAPIVGSGR